MKTSPLAIVLGALVLSLSTPAFALNILLTNDDGLTSNVKALYTALKADGHDVIVSVPCTGQSGMGGAVKFFEPLVPLSEACLNNAALPGDPGAGPVTKVEYGYDYSDFYYVNGTPIMATAYGLDVPAIARWGNGPDLVLSGPNEGQNVGPILNTSGTVSNAQFAGTRGLPAIALSAGTNTAGETEDDGHVLDNPLSTVVADLIVELIHALQKKGGRHALMLPGVALNVNFPDAVSPASEWAFSKIGSYSAYAIRFAEDLSQDPIGARIGFAEVPYPGIVVSSNQAAPTRKQSQDEAVVYQDKISVTPMQILFDADASIQRWLRWRLCDLF